MSHDIPPADHVVGDHQDAQVPLEEHVKSRETWLRLLFMVAFYVLGTLASAVLSVIVVLGFLWVLFTGERNRQLQQAGHVIAGYLYEVIRFLTYNTDERPFPFGNDLPQPPATDGD